MGRPATLRVDIVTNAKGTAKGVAEAESRLGRFGKTAAKVGKYAALGMAAAGAAAVGIGVKLHAAGERAVTADARISNITKSMGLFGKQSDAVARRVSKYAEAQARATGIDQNAIKETQAKLLTFKELAGSADQVGGSFDRATQASIDLAAAGFGTAQSNAAQLGKALNDPIKGLASLTKSGVTFTDAEKERIATLVESNKMGQAQALVLSAIETQVGGTAKATADGSARMKVAFSQLSERLGKRLVPMIDKLATWLVDKALPAASKMGRELSAKLGPILVKVGAWITGRLVPALRVMFAWFMDKIYPSIKRSVTPVLEGVKAAFAKVTAATRENSGSLQKLAKFLGALMVAFNPVREMLGKALGIAFRAAGAAISTGITAISSLVEWFEKAAAAIGWVIDKLSALKNLNPGAILDKIGSVFSSAPVFGMVSPLVTGDRSSYGLTPGLATGALTLGALAGPSPFGLPTPAAVTPYVDARDMSVSVKVDGALDAPAVARQLDRILRQHAARMGAR